LIFQWTLVYVKQTFWMLCDSFNQNLWKKDFFLEIYGLTLLHTFPLKFIDTYHPPQICPIQEIQILRSWRKLWKTNRNASFAIITGAPVLMRNRGNKRNGRPDYELSHSRLLEPNNATFVNKDLELWSTRTERSLHWSTSWVTKTLWLKMYNNLSTFWNQVRGRSTTIAKYLCPK
jgi:hypothetical protein